MESKLEYGVKDFRAQFRGLEELMDLTVVPMVDRVVRGFESVLVSRPAAYGITDVRKNLDTFYEVVMGGKLVDIYFTERNVDARNSRGYWGMNSGVKVLGRDDLARSLMGDVRSLAAAQPLESWKGEATQALREGDVSKLHEEMREYYTGGTRTPEPILQVRQIAHVGAS
ncbi:MAG: hypothetical protein HYS81_05475 [Candidatus Aenigmatarchaeota archaeon]|nr:MAG: hypothetical protein HYS81_05475 [Candidatus Aenigmarchaeota archaeon]